GTSQLKSDSKAQGGTGLGLAIAWAIADSHQGQIQVTSAPAKGTTFSVRLPLKQIMKKPNIAAQISS
ncbi:MAG: ATP-binding protein, partial [Cyanobacteria bacterium P01_F01_bin.42]